MADQSPQLRPSAIRLSPPVFSGDHADYVGWVVQVKAYVSFAFGLPSAVDTGVTGWGHGIRDADLGIVLMQCLGGEALLDADQFDGDGHRIWAHLLARHKGISPLRVARLRRQLTQVQYTHEDSAAMSAAALQRAITAISRELRLHGSSVTPSELVAIILPVLPESYQPAIRGIVKASSVDEMWEVIREHAEALDIRNGGTTLALLASQKRCYRCNQPGHLKADCPQQHAESSPSAHKQRQKQPPPSPCRHCGGSHWNRECPGRAAAATNKEATPSSATKDGTDAADNTNEVSYVAVSSAAVGHMAAHMSSPGITLIVDSGCNVPIVQHTTHFTNYTTGVSLPRISTADGSAHEGGRERHSLWVRAHVRGESEDNNDPWCAARSNIRGGSPTRSMPSADRRAYSAHRPRQDMGDRHRHHQPSMHQRVAPPDGCDGARCSPRHIKITNTSTNNAVDRSITRGSAQQAGAPQLCVDQETDQEWCSGGNHNHGRGALCPLCKSKDLQAIATKGEAPPPGRNRRNDVRRLHRALPRGVRRAHRSIRLH